MTSPTVAPASIEELEFSVECEWGSALPQVDPYQCPVPAAWNADCPGCHSNWYPACEAHYKFVMDTLGTWRWECSECLKVFAGNELQWCKI